MSRFLHANATHLTKGFKASIHDESTAAIVVNQGLRNDSEVPVAGNVETKPSLDPHGPLVPSPDPAERETLSALSLEVRSPYLYLFVDSEASLCNHIVKSSELPLPFPKVWMLHMSSGSTPVVLLRMMIKTTFPPYLRYVYIRSHALIILRFRSDIWHRRTD